MRLKFPSRMPPGKPSYKVTKPETKKKYTSVFAATILKTISYLFSLRKTTTDNEEDLKTTERKESNPSQVRTRSSKKVSKFLTSKIDRTNDNINKEDSGSSDDSDDSDVVEIEAPTSSRNNSKGNAKVNRLEKSPNMPQQRPSKHSRYEISGVGREESEIPLQVAPFRRTRQSTALERSKNSREHKDKEPQEHSGSKTLSVSEADNSNQRVLRPRKRKPQSDPEASDNEVSFDIDPAYRVPLWKPTSSRNGKKSKPYMDCPVCGKPQYSNYQMTRHMRTHTGEKPHQCMTCGNRFTRKASLIMHLRTHTGEKPYSCVVCDKRFSSYSNRKTHMSVHSTERPYVCERCGKTFTRKSHLNGHMRMHLGIRPHNCTVCEKSFAQSYDLKCHMRIHTGEKPYLCTLCPRAFTQNGGLKIHMDTHTRNKRKGGGGRGK